MAAYATDDLADDPTASLLAALGVAPLRVSPGPDAAENALLAHARRMQAEGYTRFTVCSVAVLHQIYAKVIAGLEAAAHERIEKALGWSDPSGGATGETTRT